MGEELEKLSGKLGVDTTDFKRGIAAANRELRVLESSFKASSASLGDWSKSASGLEMRIKSLTSQIEIQRLKVSALKENYEKIRAEQGANSRAAKDAEIAYNKQVETLGKMERELGDTEKALKDVTEEEKDAGKETDKLRHAQDKTSASTGRMSIALSGLKKMAAGTVGALASLTKRVASMAVGLAVGAAKLSATVAVGAAVMLAGTVKPASDLSETLSKTQTVFGSMSETVIKDAQAAAAQMGVSQKSYMDYASALGAAFTAGGMGITDATALSEQAVKHFADLASFHNSEVQDVAESWQSAVRGSYEPIQKYFPFITNEYLKTYGTAKGLIDENTENLTANQRAIILNAIALDTQLNPAYGDFERTSGGLANQQRIFAANVENTRARIGSGLLPVVTQLVTMLNKFLASEAAQAGIEKIKTTLEGFGKTIETILASFDGREFSMGEFIQKLFGEFDLSSIVDKLFGNFDLGALIGKLFSPDRGLNLLNFGLGIINSIIDSIIAGIPNLLPAALGILEKLVEFLTTGLPLLIDQAVPLLLALVSGILAALPLVLEAAIQIILALAIGLSAAAPQLIPTIVSVLLTLIQTLLDNLPLVIDVALKLILALGQGLIAALPVLIPQIPVIVQAIFDTLVASLPLIISAALELINALVLGLLQNVPLLLSAAGQVLLALAEYLYKDGPKMFVEIGKALIDGMWTGIKNNFGQLVTNFKTLAGGLIESVKEVFKMKSPSRVGKYIGGNFVSSIGLGGDDEAPKVRKLLTRHMLRLADDLSAVTAPTIGVPATGAVGSGTISIGEIVINIPGTTATPQQIAVAAQEGVLSAVRKIGGG